MGGNRSLLRGALLRDSFKFHACARVLLVVWFDPRPQTLSKVDITQDFLLLGSMCAREQSPADFTGLPVGFNWKHGRVCVRVRARACGLVGGLRSGLTAD